MSVRKIIEIDEEKCDGCGQCVLACAEGALKIIDGKAKVISEVFCDGLGACIGECPRDALRIIEREAPAFDEKAVEAHLNHVSPDQGHTDAACGCQSSTPMVVRGFAKHGHMDSVTETPSELSNWPVQWRLISPGAEFYKGADMIIAADCVPFAFGGFHRRFLKGRPLVIGCPKLDEQAAYLDKLTTLFTQAKPRSIAIVIMEVPCCRGLVRLVSEAVKRSATEVPVKTTIVSIDGRVLEES